MLESTITFLPVAYYTVNGKYEAPNNPIPESLWKNSGYKEHYEEMYKSGWKLVNVQPLLRGMYNFQTSGALNAFAKDSWAMSYGYPLTAGYYFFWEREKSI